MKDFLAIDIGASSGRHILGRLENGRMELTEIYRFSNSPQKTDGCLTWDVDRLFGEILNGLKRAKELGRVPACIGIDTWGVDYVLLDKSGARIGEAFSYRSDRTEAVIPAVHKAVPFETLYARTGIQFQPFNTIYQVCADKASGKLEKAAHLLMLPDYFHYLLTGKMSREYTNATTTGLVNAKTRTWDRELLQELALPAHLFPETVQAGESLGRLKKEIRDIVGYDAEVIVPATHDTASAVCASLTDGDPYLSSGTWSLLGILQSQAHTDEVSMQYNYSNEGHIQGGVRFQKNIMGLWIIQQIRHETGDKYSFAELADLARKSPNGYEINVNDARFLSPANMTREVYDAVGRQLSIGETAYCVFNGLAKSYRGAIIELERMTGKKFGSLNLIGGGSQNGLLNELTARATGLKIVTGPTEATAIGNLLVQMTAKGELAQGDYKTIIKKSFDIGETV